MARSLSRNTKLFVSTLDDIVTGSPSTTNTFEVKILDGYSFSQDTTNQQISVNEAGCTTVRGTQSFNTALNPAQVSFSVYARPEKYGGNTRCPEAILWNAAFATTYNGAETQVTADQLKFDLDESNANELLTLTLYFKYESTVYKITNFSVDSIEFDFSIDSIATITFSGMGSDIVEDQAAFDFMTVDPATDWIAGTDYLEAPAATSSSFLRNKLSTIELSDNKSETANETDAVGSITDKTITLSGTITTDIYAGGRVSHSTTTPSATTPASATIVSNTTGAVTVSAGDDIDGWSGSDVLEFFTEDQHAGVTYSIPITGGSLTFSNNMSYLTPEELAIVNRPLAGFTGGRSTSGSLTAYLNTGAVGSGGLLDDLLRKITEVTNNFDLTIHVGECSASPTFQVEINMPYCNIGVPTTNVQDIISTEISFVAQEWDTVNDVPSFEATNSLTVSYWKT